MQKQIVVLAVAAALTIGATLAKADSTTPDNDCVSMPDFTYKLPDGSYCEDGQHMGDWKIFDASIESKIGAIKVECTGWGDSGCRMRGACWYHTNKKIHVYYPQDYSSQPSEEILSANMNEVQSAPDLYGYDCDASGFFLTIGGGCDLQTGCQPDRSSRISTKDMVLAAGKGALSPDDYKQLKNQLSDDENND